MPAKNATITKDQAKEELLTLIGILGKTPTRNEFIKLNTLKGCHKQGIMLLFGANPYTELLKYSGVELNQQLKQPSIEVHCKHCNSIIIKYYNDAKRSINQFCSSSCAALYNNKHKSFGTRRSKLEVYLENKLTERIT